MRAVQHVTTAQPVNTSPTKGRRLNRAVPGVLLMQTAPLAVQFAFAMLVILGTMVLNVSLVLQELTSLLMDQLLAQGVGAIHTRLQVA